MTATQTPKFNPETYAPIPSSHLLVYAVYDLHNRIETISPEDVISACFTSFPQRFSLKKYPQWPDSAMIGRRLHDCRIRKWIAAKTDHEVRLTFKGMRLAERTARALGLKVPVWKSKPKVAVVETPKPGPVAKVTTPVTKAKPSPAKPRVRVPVVETLKQEVKVTKPASSPRVKPKPARKIVTPVAKPKPMEKALPVAKTPKPVVKVPAPVAKPAPIKRKPTEKAKAPIIEAPKPVEKKAATPVAKPVAVKPKPAKKTKAPVVETPKPVEKKAAAPVAKPAPVKPKPAAKTVAPVTKPKAKAPKPVLHAQPKKRVAEVKVAEAVKPAPATKPGPIAKPKAKVVPPPAVHRQLSLIPTVSAEEKARAGKFVKMMEASDAYRLYKKNGANANIGEFDFRSLLLCTMESSPETLARNVELFKSYAVIHNRQDLITFLGFCAEKFAHLLLPEKKAVRKLR